MSTRFLDRLRSRILLCDGAIGTWIQSRDWDVVKEFLG
jgi:methionine synthase I (cobalamin-dependent)